MRKPKWKRLMLMFPPFYRLYGDDQETASHNIYPLGIGYLAAMAHEHTDWTVQSVVGDARFENAAFFSMPLIRMAGSGFDNYLATLRNPGAPIWAEIREDIRAFAPEVLGLSATSQNWKAATMVAAIAKQLDPEMIVITGGPHSSMAQHRVFECPDIDINVAGEGEAALLDILKALEDGRSLDTVKGISFRDKAGQIIITPPRGFIEDIDALPFPAKAAPYVLKNYEKFPRMAFRSLFALRGCPYNCQFCGSRNIWSRKARFRSPANVVAEMKYLWESGVRHHHFEDDLFGIKPAYIKELCSLIRAELPEITWSCELTVTTVTDENLAAMRAGGCISISFGIESGNDEMLKIIRKIQTVADVREAARLLRKHDIKSSAFFMIGFPEETEETMNDTMELMRTIDIDNIIFSIFTPYPDTEMFDICKKKGLIPDDYDVSLYNHQSLENCFSDRIPRDRFRQLASSALAEVDLLNQKKWDAWAVREADANRVKNKLAQYKIVNFSSLISELERKVLIVSLAMAFFRALHASGARTAIRKSAAYITIKSTQMLGKGAT